MKTTEQTSSGLRDMLFDTLEGLRTGRVEPTKAKAIAAISHQIIETVKMEIEVAKLRRDYPGDIKLQIPPPLMLKVAAGA